MMDQLLLKHSLIKKLKTQEKTKKKKKKKKQYPPPPPPPHTHTHNYSSGQCVNVEYEQKTYQGLVFDVKDNQYKISLSQTGWAQKIHRTMSEHSYHRATACSLYYIV